MKPFAIPMWISSIAAMVPTFLLTIVAYAAGITFERAALIFLVYFASFFSLIFMVLISAYLFAKPDPTKKKESVRNE